MVGPFRFDDVGARMDRAYERVNALAADQARVRAGNALSGGDYRGAAGELFRSGDVDGGARLAYYGDRREADQRQASVDREKAATEAWGQAAERLSRILDESKDDPNAVLGAFDTYFSPRLQSLGETPDEIAQVRGMLQQSPRQALLALGAGAAKKLGYDTSVVGDELMVTSKDTGQVIGRYRGGRTLNVPEGRAVYDIPGGGGPIGDPSQYRTPDFNPQVQRDRPAPNMGDVGPAISGALPRNQRNNNPGNIKDGPFAQSLPGYAGSDGTFARFDTYEAGRSAQQRLLASYGQRGFNTVKSIIDRWAPPSDNNPTRSYIDFVARKLGVSPRETLDMQNPQVLAALADAIQQFEGGGPAAGGEALAGGAGSDTVQPSSAPQGARLLVSRPKEREAPSGYRWQGDQLVAVEGGPADKASEPLTPAQVFTQENQLRNQFGGQTAVKDMASVRSHVATIGAIAQKARAGEPVTAADDLALIFAFMKMLDPGSVVREGEFANAQNTGGIPDRIVNAYNRALNGTRLSDKQRNEFFQTATTVMDNYTNAYADQADRSRSVASSYGLSPDRVAATPNRPKPRSQSTPRAAGENPAIVAARAAIRQGAPRAAVIQRLRDNGIDPKGL